MENCTDVECGIHNRVDQEREETHMGESFLDKITYRGEWAVFTTENTFALYVAMLGGATFDHMTLLVKVGDGTISDIMGDPDSMKNAVYEGSLTSGSVNTRDAHGMLVSGVESGLLTDISQPMRPYEMVMRYVKD